MSEHRPNHYVDNQNGNLDNINLRYQFLYDNKISIILIVSIAVVSSLVTGLVVGFVVHHSKTTKTCNCPEKSTGPPYSKYDCNNTTLIPEAICQLPWPEVDTKCSVTDLGHMKCLLPYKGKFVIQADIHNNGKITRICQGEPLNDDYDYKIVCNDRDIDGCLSACNEKCQSETLEFRRKEPTTVVIVVDGSCLKNGGQIEIWDIKIYGNWKRNATIF